MVMRSNGDIIDQQSGVFKGYQQALTEESARYEKICLPEQTDERTTKVNKYASSTKRSGKQ